MEKEQKKMKMNKLEICKVSKIDVLFHFILLWILEICYAYFV